MSHDNSPCRSERPDRPFFGLLAFAAAVAVALAGGCARAANDPAPSAQTDSKIELVPTVTPPPIHGAVNVEKVYYAQFQLLRNATHDLTEQRPGIPDMYFVGFAGDASQDVFLREIRSVHTLFDDRFDTRGRSVVLVNNLSTVATAPLASTHNLLAALDQIALRMDKEEDVLFLFLTSHGTPGVLAVSFDPLQLNDLTARSLRSMLDRSGIKWRVIVISACYSGSFIEPLKNDDTMIVTAARHDRASFGCTNENEFTYFGRAYFDQALRKTYSFADAFETARTTVAKWEKDEKLKPSLPQIYIGPAIRPKLAEIEERLRDLVPAH
jgi:Peptidase C13 family